MENNGLIIWNLGSQATDDILEMETGSILCRTITRAYLEPQVCGLLLKQSITLEGWKQLGLYFNSIPNVLLGINSSPAVALWGSD